MRIRTDGDYAHRLDVIEAAMGALDENTKNDAVLAAGKHARQDRRAKENPLEHPKLTPELAEILSTSELHLEYDVEISLTSK